ncbi:hypothetical protein BWQ96_04116 [Gracilariopsis chorda]|uniref:Uncharacterized protein n=1 Tax=Gracilariopsis chorda TaxID=448386 RepID=A0A2V3IYA0_9FLOR|nr:hypothetical protein BWQ96_04116 [Gracilariopsis chorda]|eukprot:PXF46110.1 hypothetical protein BWQ96_04116 [Gracilariopsis chorda]
MAFPSVASLFIILFLNVWALARAVSFSSIGLGAGAGSPKFGVFGLSGVLGNGNIAAVGTGGSGGGVSGATSVISPAGKTSNEGDVVAAGSPGAIPNMDLSSLLARPVEAVPDYRDTGASRGYTSTESSERKKRKVKVKKKTSSWQTEGRHAPKMCWTVSKHCCYEEVQKGYECKDYYAYKYARCHPVIEFDEVCGDIKETPAEHPRPKGRVKYEESVLKNYDANYGPHVAGYPKDGESEYYRTDTIPSKPHGVTENAYPAPQAYESGSGGGTYKTENKQSANETEIIVESSEVGETGSQGYQASGAEQPYDGETAGNSAENAVEQNMSKSSEEDAAGGSYASGSAELPAAGASYDGNGPSY